MQTLETETKEEIDYDSLSQIEKAQLARKVGRAYATVRGFKPADLELDQWSEDKFFNFFKFMAALMQVDGHKWDVLNKGAAARRYAYDSTIPDLNEFWYRLDANTGSELGNRARRHLQRVGEYFQAHPQRLTPRLMEVVDRNKFFYKAVYGKPKPSDAPEPGVDPVVDTFRDNMLLGRVKPVERPMEGENTIVVTPEGETLSISKEMDSREMLEANILNANRLLNQLMKQVGNKELKTMETKDKLNSITKLITALKTTPGNRGGARPRKAIFNQFNFNDPDALGAKDGVKDLEADLIAYASGEVDEDEEE